MSIVDVHAHVLLPQLQQHVGELDPDGLASQQALELHRQGSESSVASRHMVGERIEQLTNVEQRLIDMDEAHVEVQVVSPSPSHYYYFLGQDHASHICRQANAAVADHVRQAPDRLRGLGLVPLQHPALMVDALEDAVVTQGLLGVEIGSFATAGKETQASESEKTVELSDVRLEPFWARAEQLNAVIFLHPFGCSLGARLDRFYLANTVAQPAENAMALSHLIFSGVLDRHPRLRIIAAHGGGYLPATIGRSDRAWEVRPEAGGCAEPPSQYLSRLYFDSLTHSPQELAALVAKVGADRVLLGSDYPFDMGSEDPVAAVRATSLTQDQQNQILGGTAAALGFNDRISSTAEKG